jgi:hypothetical protein
VKALSKRAGRLVFLSRIRKRKFAWPGIVGLVTIKSAFKRFVVPGIITLDGVRLHGLYEIEANAFDYRSQDGLFSMSNPAAISTLVTTKGLGAGTTITEVLADAPPALLTVDIAT